MSWQTILISNPSKLSIKNNNILLKQADTEPTIIAISEVSVIVIDNPQVLLTAVFITSCAKFNIVVIFCDNKHTPVGVYYPYYQHSRHAKNTLTQINCGRVLQNKLWQKIIKVKIQNQQSVLQLTTKNNNSLAHIINQVQSADKTNREAYAAKIYWSILFDNNFLRSDVANSINSALDYGYSIIRSTMTRSIAASGMVPAIGIHHKSELNAFNLADDLIEPFRPFVDLLVYKNIDNLSSDILSKDNKVALVNILNENVYCNNKKTTMLTTITTCCQSLLKAIYNKDVSCLLLPSIV